MKRPSLPVLVAAAAAVLLAVTTARGATAQVADPIAAAAPGQERAVYHVDDMASARDALKNMANHLDASPQAKLALVANGRGIYLLVDGERDRQGAYADAVKALEARGVRFFACNNSMKANNIEASSLVSGVQVVPAGVSALARLEGLEHYAYIKP